LEEEEEEEIVYKTLNVHVLPYDVTPYDVALRIRRCA